MQHTLCWKSQGGAEEHHYSFDEISLMTQMEKLDWSRSNGIEREKININTMYCTCWMMMNSIVVESIGNADLPFS